jgi:ribulose 1,5-bisphosphate synthetase/thiazole synthase
MNITPGEVSREHQKLIGKYLDTINFASFLEERNVDLSASYEIDFSDIDLDNAEKAISEYAAKNINNLFLAGLAEAALAGVQINHPSALNVN